MKRWEYKLINDDDPAPSVFKKWNREALEAYLNQIGAEGWELVNIDTHDITGWVAFTAVAKRESSVIVLAHCRRLYWRADWIGRCQPDYGVQRPALRAAADAERWTKPAGQMGRTS